MVQIVKQARLHISGQPLQIFLESMGATEAQLMMVIIILPQIPFGKRVD